MCSKLSVRSGRRLEAWTVTPSVEGCDLEKRLGCSPCLSRVEEGEVFQLGFFLEPTPLPVPWHLGAGSLEKVVLSHTYGPHTVLRTLHVR